MSGDAGGRTITVSELAPNNGTTYDVAVSGMNRIGTVVATILANAVTDAFGNRNLASTSTDNTVTFGSDATPPSASPTVSSGTLGSNGWFTSDVSIAWNWADNTGGVGLDPANCTTSSPSSGEGALTLSATCKDLAGNPGSASYPINIDKSAPTIAASAADSTPYTAGAWTNQTVTVHFTCSDGVSGLAGACPADQVMSAEGVTAAVNGIVTDTAGNSASASFGPLQIDRTKPVISAGRSPAANPNGWNNGDVTVSFICADSANGAGIATNTVAGATVSAEGSNQSVTNTGACMDSAGNVADAATIGNISIDKTAPVVAVTGVTNGGSYTLGSVPAAACSTADALSGVVTQATVNVTGGNPNGTGTLTATCSGATDNAGNSAAPVSVSYTVTGVVADVCTTAGLLDNFNRANGGLGSNWAGLTNQTFYKIAGNKVDVQLGGAVLWNPTSFGTSQAAFVTLSTIDNASPSQGVLLKVQTGSIPNAGAIGVIYTKLNNTVRVATLRLNDPTWTVYSMVPAAFANGDKLGGCVLADGTVRIYKNNTLISTVTLNAADKSFFNGKGGKVGLWTVAAPNAFFDDFGGGSVTQ